MVGLALSTSFNELDEWFDSVTTHGDGLLDRGDINHPHIDSEVTSSTSENILAVRACTNILHFIWVGNESHSLVRVTVERQLDKTNDFLVGRVEQVLLAIPALLVEKLELGDFATVGWSKASPT